MATLGTLRCLREVLWQTPQGTEVNSGFTGGYRLAALVRIRRGVGGWVGGRGPGLWGSGRRGRPFEDSLDPKRLRTPTSLYKFGWDLVWECCVGRRCVIVFDMSRM